MRLDNEEESRNIEDRRASSGGGMRLPSFGTMMMLWPVVRPLLRSKIGLAVVGIGLLAYMSGFNPFHHASAGSTNKRVEDRRAHFVAKVLANTEKVWSAILSKYGMRYQKPKVVLYRGSTHSGCGGAMAQMGPFYCPVDRKIYVDLSFFDELARRHDAPGDFAQAYVLAHEIGHHIQNMQGTLDKVQRLKQSWGGNSARSNALQVRVELQADCYAGVWGHYAYKQGLLDPGDAEEALRAASAIGDDTLQRQTQGYVRPDAFTHGTSKQRVEWFARGFKSGDLRACDTFSQ